PSPCASRPRSASRSTAPSIMPAASNGCSTTRGSSATSSGRQMTMTRAMTHRPRGNPIHGWLIIDKPAGMTSTRVVGAVRRLTGPARAGHGGTLDPLATGLLPVALGEATKTAAYVLDGTKRYRFTVRWGEARSTDDAEGEVTATSDVRPDSAAIRAVLARFRG